MRIAFYPVHYTKSIMMSVNRALISSWTGSQKPFRDDHVKLCFLWYDEVIFETLRDDEDIHKNILGLENLDRNDFYYFTDVILPFEKISSSGLVAETRKLDLRGYPRLCTEDGINYTYPNPRNAEEYAHNKLIKRIEIEKGVEKFYDNDVEFFEGRARVAVDAVLLWEKLNSEVTCMLQASDDEKIAMAAALEYNSVGFKQIEPFLLFESSVPSLERVPWREILKLRKKGNFDSLREKLAQIVTEPQDDLDKAQSELTALENQAVCEILEQYRPNVRKVSIESMLANVPGVPILNPASLFFGLRDVKSEIDKAKNFNWFYLLSDIRGLTKDNNA